MSRQICPDGVAPLIRAEEKFFVELIPDRQVLLVRTGVTLDE